MRASPVIRFGILLVCVFAVLCAGDVFGQPAPAPAVSHTCPQGFTMDRSVAGQEVYRCEPARDRWGDALLAGYVSLAAADLAQTSRCLGAGTCLELNPVLRPIAHQPVLLGAVKAGLTLATVRVCTRYPARSRARYGCLTGAVALQAGVVAWNAYALRGQMR